MPGLTRLTQLKVLKLQPPLDAFSGNLQPSLLSAFTNLEHLTLQFNHLIPSTTGAQHLLAILPQLQQLTALKLQMDSPDMQAPPQAALTALTANSNLRHLSLDETTLPYGVRLQQVFAPNTNRLLQLEELSLLDKSVMEELDLSDIECIARCCPNLKAFSFKGVMAEEVPLLTGLTKLHCGDTDVTGVNDDFVCALVQQLSGLRDLHLYNTGTCTADGLLALTGLQQLTRLAFYFLPNSAREREFLQKVSHGRLCMLTWLHCPSFHVSAVTVQGCASLQCYQHLMPWVVCMALLSPAARCQCRSATADKGAHR